MGIKSETEWPTWAILVGTYTVWILALFLLPTWLSLPVAALAIAQHSSLQHEVIHGHPTKWPWLNAGLVFPSLGLFIPFGRFRDTHLAHHQDAQLTDPYDDPESNYLAKPEFDRQPGWVKILLKVNNCLIGRMLIGPIFGYWVFLRGDWRHLDARIARTWLIHLVSVVLVLSIVMASPIPLWAYLAAAYLGLSILKIRTFLEHQAHEFARARTVIVEDRGPLALLFLNNNFHAVHHMHPQVPWYRLPSLYRSRQDHFLDCNEGYRYSCYGDVFRRYFLRVKDPVAHPLWHKEGLQQEERQA